MIFVTVIVVVIVLTTILLLKYERAKWLDTRSYASLEHNFETIRGEIPRFDIADVEFQRKRPDEFFRVKGAPKPKWTLGWFTDTWYVFPLIYQGQEVLKQVCPQTSRILNSIPGIRTAGFALLPEGEELPIHTDVSTIAVNMLLIGQGTVTVDRTPMKLQPGKAVAFDSTRKHSAKNTGKGHRIILYGHCNFFLMS